MDGLRKWWSRHNITILTSTLVILAAWGIRHTQGSVLVDAFYWVTSPWHPSPEVERILANATSQELQARVAELEYQNQELKRLLGFSEQITGEGLPAPVIGRGADHWWQQLTLGRGHTQGIQPGYVVMAPGGLVGRVEEVTRNTSRVLLISDPTSRVGVMLSRTRHMGVLRGTGSQDAVLSFFDKELAIEVGDTVVTSGLSSLYPAGVMVGKVRSVDLDASPAPQAMVELSAPLGLLEWGLIYTYAQSVTADP